MRSAGLLRSRIMLHKFFLTGPHPEINLVGCQLVPDPANRAFLNQMLLWLKQ